MRSCSTATAGLIPRSTASAAIPATVASMPARTRAPASSTSASPSACEDDHDHETLLDRTARAFAGDRCMQRPAHGDPPVLPDRGYVLQDARRRPQRHARRLPAARHRRPVPLVAVADDGHGVGPGAHAPRRAELPDEYPRLPPLGPTT